MDQSAEDEPPVEDDAADGGAGGHRGRGGHARGREEPVPVDEVEVEARAGLRRVRGEVGELGHLPPQQADLPA